VGCTVMLSSITTTCTPGSSFPTGQNLRGSTRNFPRDRSAQETHLCTYHTALSNGFSISGYTALDARMTNERNGVFNLLKPIGYVMHIQQLYALPTLYTCVLYLSENKQQLVLLTA